MAVIESLQTVRRRVRALAVLYGGGIVISAAAGLLLATVLVDYLLNLPPAPRIIIFLAALGTMGFLLARWVIRPALARLGLSDVAGKLETAFPQFDDRLRSTVDFLTKPAPGSQVMKERVVGQTLELTGRLHLSSAIRTRPMWQSLAAAIGSLAVVLLLALLLGRDYWLPALSRLLTPFDGRPWPKRVQIQLVGQLPQRVPAGKHIDLRLRLTKGDSPSRQALVYSDYGDGRVEKELMTRGPDGVFAASIDARGEGLITLWMAAGDDATPPRTIAVVGRLAITAAQLTVTPPPYAAQGPTAVQLDAAPATVTYGSDLSLRLTFNKPLDPSRAMVLSAAAGMPAVPDVSWNPPTGAVASGHWIARQSCVFTVHGFDADGFSNADEAQYQVIVRPDTPPAVQITQPGRNQECTLQAVVPLRAIAEDDYAIKSLKLIAVRLGERPQPLATIDLVRDGQVAGGVGWTPLESSGSQRRWQMDLAWDLSRLDASALKSGDVIEYFLEAQDNFAFEGQTHPPVASARYRIAILSQEQFTSLMSDLMDQLRQQIIDIRNSQRSLTDQTGDLRHETAKQAKFSAADRAAAAGLVAAQATAASQTKQVSAKLDELVRRMDQNKSTAQDLRAIASGVRDDLNDLAEHPMKEAAAQIDDAKDRTGGADARNAQLDAAQRNQQAAADKLDQDAARMGQAGGLPKMIQQLQDLLSQQRAISQTSDDIGLKNLGKRPDQLDDADRKAQQQNADKQDALAEQTQRTIDQLNAMAQKLGKTDSTSAAAMQQAARAGQQQSVPGQMHAGADAQRQNQQSAAQQAQTQAEIGLQMMLHELQEAQNRKLEQLARQLADLQEQIASLIRQQASLNYQNLSLQGADVLAKADAKLIAALLDQAQWTAGHVPPIPDLQTQMRLQEQTERNTRSIAKSAQALPEGAAISAGLDRASVRMGRAITFLRDDSVADRERLAGAYDPPQVEALDALQKVRQIVDEQARRNAEQLQQKTKDSIRVAYEKILAGQKKIDADTAGIDKAARTPDGQLGHRDAIRLGQLPAEQGQLADRAAQLDEQLSSLQSIVYVWANKDIVDSMRTVQADLAKPRTDAVTQAQQQRIEEQIAAMIESLKLNPRQSPFANPRGGGGGGGGGAPPLPPEAELRLLRQLQAAINKATKTIFDQGNAQEPQLVTLGGRQGQIRNLLDQVLQKASRGRVKLGAEPDPSEKLPEEAGEEAIENQELEHALLHDDGQPDADQMKKDLDLIGQRMGRSRQRLAVHHDPGKTTQEIQKRILQNLDTLIEMARAEETRAQPSRAQASQPLDPTQQAQPDNSQPGRPQGPSRNNGTTPARTSTNDRDVDTTSTPTLDITQTLKEWGALSPRRRAAVVEAASEKPIEKFKSLIDDYYRSLGTRGGQ